MAAMREQIMAAIKKVLDSGWYVLGPNVQAFEAEFAAYCGAPHCIGVGNGTDALELALRAVGAGPGRDVVTVANAGMYSTSAIVAVGATPVLADIEAATMGMSADALADCIGENTVAVIVTHLYGRIADIERLAAVCARHGCALIEDCAQAHGAERDGRKAGTFGLIGCFSFYPTKNLGALGDGGALVTVNERTAETLRRLSQYGWRGKYTVERVGGRNSRLDELQAAILRAKLPRLDEWNGRRRDIMRRYCDSLPSGISMATPEGSDHVAHLCVVRCPERAKLRDWLTARRIGTDIHYPIPDHRQPGMQGIFPPDLSLPATEAAAAEILTLPCFPEMMEDEIVRVCDALAAFGRQ
jgi:dTDP-4-amino-4,6-dideoxygalactose transaminase